MKKISAEYVGGLIDAEGTITLIIERLSNNHLKIKPYIAISLLCNKDYMGGVFDGDGSAQIKIQKDKRSSFGLHVNPLLVLRSRHKQFLELLKANYGGNIRTSGNSFVWCVSSLEEVRAFINVILFSTILKREELLILDEAVTLMELGEHHTIEGMFYILKLAEKLSFFHTKGPKRKDWLRIFKEIIGEKEFTRLERLYEEGKMESVTV